MSTNIDRSLDDIIKEQKKLNKKKTQKLKTQQTQKKGVKQQQGRKQTKGVAANQKQRKRIGGKQNGQSGQQRQATQGRRRPIAGKQRAQQKQATQGQRRVISGKNQGRGGAGVNQNVKRNTTVGNRGRFGGAKATANRLKNKQGSLQRSKQIISKAKQLQQNNRSKTRVNRQTQQSDARQNIINNRRGIQGPLKGNRQNKNKAQNAKNLSNRNFGTPRIQRRNRRGIQSPQLTVSINNPRVRLARTPQWEQAVSNQLNKQTNGRRWRGGARRAGGNPSIMGPTEDLRISVPNNLHQPAALRPLLYSNYDLPVNSSAPGKTFATLNERFSSFSQTQSVRTIVVD